MASPSTTPVIAGLAAGAGFILLIGITIEFPVLFSMTRTFGNQEGIKIITIQADELEQEFPMLADAKESVDRIKSRAGPFASPYDTFIPMMEANLLRAELPFVESSHPDQNFRGHYLVIKVVDEEEKNKPKMYLIGLKYLKLV